MTHLDEHERLSAVVRSGNDAYLTPPLGRHHNVRILRLGAPQTHALTRETISQFASIAFYKPPREGKRYDAHPFSTANHAG